MKKDITAPNSDSTPCRSRCSSRSARARRDRGRASKATCATLRSCELMTADSVIYTERKNRLTLSSDKQLCEAQDVDRSGSLNRPLLPAPRSVSIYPPDPRSRAGSNASRCGSVESLVHGRLRSGHHSREHAPRNLGRRTAVLRRGRGGKSDEQEGGSSTTMCASFRARPLLMVSRSQIKTLTLSLVRTTSLYRSGGRTAHGATESQLVQCTKKKVAETTLELGKKSSSGPTAKGSWIGVEAGTSASFSPTLVIPVRAVPSVRSRRFR